MSMNKWMRRRLDYLRSQLQKQEMDLDVARRRNDTSAIDRIEREVETTKVEMVRVIER